MPQGGWGNEKKIEKIRTWELQGEKRKIKLWIHNRFLYDYINPILIPHKDKDSLTDDKSKNIIRNISNPIATLTKKLNDLGCAEYTNLKNQLVQYKTKMESDDYRHQAKTEEIKQDFTELKGLVLEISGLLKE